MIELIVLIATFTPAKPSNTWELETPIKPQLVIEQRVQQFKKQEPPKKGINLKITSYNAERGQTDSTPCIAWGTSINVCTSAKKGVRVLALSQDLTSWSTLWKKRTKQGLVTFLPYEKVELKQTAESIKAIGYRRQCNWTFQVSDAMNARYRNRWDLFFLSRKDNISCDSIIYKK